MPIALSCDSCGKQLRAKDESAGKKIKCPGCGNVLAVPQSEEMTEEMHAEETASPPAPPEKISVSCGCGKKLQVKGELAGKAVKCPGCQKVIKVPLPASNGAAAASKKAAPAKKPSPPPADDDNDFSFSKTPSKTGKKAPARMPDEEEDEFSFTANKSKAKKPPRPLDEDDEDDGGDEDFRVPPRGGKAKKSSNRTMLLLVLLLVVVGLGAGAYFLIPMFFGGDPNHVAQNNNPKGPPPKGPPPKGPVSPVVPPPVVQQDPDFALIPRDAQGVVVVRIGSYLASEPGKNLKMWVEQKLNMFKVDAKKQAGFELDDVERVTIVARSAKDKSGYALVLGKKPIADSALAIDDIKSAPTVKVGEYTIYKNDLKGTAAFKVDDKLFVFGDFATLSSLAEKKIADKGPLEDALAEVQASKTLVTIATGSFKDVDMPGVPPDIANDFKPIAKLVFTFDETPTELAFAANVYFEMPEQAKAFKEKLQNGYLPIAKGGLTSIKAGVPPEIGPLFDSVEKGVNDTKIADEGNKVTAQVQFAGLSLTSILDTGFTMYMSRSSPPPPLPLPENKEEKKPTVPEDKGEEKKPTPPPESKEEKKPATPDDKGEEKKPTPPEGKGPELKKSDDLPPLPKLPLDKKPELPPLPIVSPEKKPELPQPVPPVDKKEAKSADSQTRQAPPLARDRAVGVRNTLS